MEKKATAVFMGERISYKQSMQVASAVAGKNLKSAKLLLNEVLGDRKYIDGTHSYPKTTEAFLKLLSSAEANAKQKNLNTEKLFVKVAKADRGYKFVRPKSIAKFRGREAKVTNISVVLEEK